MSDQVPKLDGEARRSEQHPVKALEAQREGVPVAWPVLLEFDACDPLKLATSILTQGGYHRQNIHESPQRQPTTSDELAVHRKDPVLCGVKTDPFEDNADHWQVDVGFAAPPLVAGHCMQTAAAWLGREGEHQHANRPRGQGGESGKALENRRETDPAMAGCAPCRASHTNETERWPMTVGISIRKQVSLAWGSFKCGLRSLRRVSIVGPADWKPLVFIHNHLGTP